jgi:hypothetical protein
MKIVLCVPGRQFSNRFLASWTSVVVNLIQEGHEVVISQKYSSMVHFARAMCLGADVFAGKDQVPFQGQVDYDVLLWIDSDIVFNYEQVIRIIQSPHQVTSGLYMMENNTHLCAVREWDEGYYWKNGGFEFVTNESIQRWKDEHPSEPYMKCSYAGMGFMAIKKGVIENLEYPWFYRPVYSITNKETGQTIQDIHSEDVCFCKNIQDKGIDIYVDTNIRVGHEKSVVM